MDVDGSRVVVRYRKDLPDETFRSRYPVMADVIWDYEGDPITGMPVSPEKERLYAFEDELIGVLGDSDVSQEAVTFTGNGAKVWRFFTCGSAEFGEKLESLLRDLPVSPISLDFSDDLDWDNLESVIAAGRRSRSVD